MQVTRNVSGGGHVRKRPAEKREHTAFLEEIAAQRAATQDLVEKYELESQRSQGALSAVGKAREERDQYRRVLAAAIGVERRREAEVAELHAERRRLEFLAQEEVRSASREAAHREEMGQRLERLEARFAEQESAHAREAADAADRAWAERSAAREELTRMVVAHRAEFSSALAAASGAPAGIDSPGAAEASPATVAPLDSDELLAGKVRRRRAQLLVGISVALTLVAVALIPLAVLSVSDPERALFVHLASGLGPRHLVGAVAASLGLATWLLTWALRDLERTGTQAAPGAVQDASRLRDFRLPGPRSSAAGEQGERKNAGSSPSSVNGSAQEGAGLG